MEKLDDTQWPVRPGARVRRRHLVTASAHAAEEGGFADLVGQASRRLVELDFFACFEQTGATIRHFHYDDSAIPVSRDLATLVRLVETNRLHPELGLVANWSQTASALQQLRERRLRGKAVLCIPTHPKPERTAHEPVT